VAIKIFQHYLNLPLAFLACLEAGLFLCAPYWAAMARFQTTQIADIEHLTGPILPRAIAFAGVTLVAMAAMGLYNSRQRSRLLGMLTRIAAALLGALFLSTVIYYAVPALFLGRGALVLTAGIAFLSAFLVRVVFDRVVDEEVFKRRIIVFGAGRRASSIAKLRRRSDRRGFAVVGYLPADGDEPGLVPGDLCIDARGSLLAYCDQHLVDEIVVAMDDRRRGFPMDQLLECRLEGVEITELVTFFERETGKVRLDVLNPSWMIFSDGFRQGRVHNLLERLFDITASLMLLIVALPIMVLTIIAIKVEDGLRAPVLYRQTRVGQYGRPFKLMKFRSMRIDAESKGKPIWATKNDSRVTRIGTFIRKTRIDELPQILNVLRGEMSFVGPRPERPEFVSQLNERIPYYRERHSIKPGLTGWAQLCYPYGSSEQDAAEKLQYDLFYVKNHSPLFYLAIVVQTVEVIVWGKGAR
jgi:sugar transferase (PEP-CTERM system associated)